MKAKATILLKTKTGQTSDLAKATMYMKTNDVFFLKPRCVGKVRRLEKIEERKPEIAACAQDRSGSIPHVI